MWRTPVGDVMLSSVSIPPITSIPTKIWPWLRRNGAFVRELPVAPDTPVDLGFVPGSRGVNLSALTAPGNRPQAAAFGAPSTIGFSSDPEQRYLYIGDNQMIHARRLRLDAVSTGLPAVACSRPKSAR